MTVRRVRVSEWRQRYRQALLERTAEFDIDNGFIPDVLINPTSFVLDNQNETINYLYSLVTLNDSVALDIADVEQFVSVNDVFINEGSRSTVDLTVIRFTVPLTDLTIPRGFPFIAYENGNSAIYFVSTREITLPVANAANYFNPNRGRYEINVPAISLGRGPDVQVGPGAINAFGRILSGFDEVINISPSTPSLTLDDVDSLIRKFRLSVIGQDRSTPNGVSKYIRNNFSNVSQTLSVYGKNNPRADTEPGAVDQYILGRLERTQTDFFTYTGESLISMKVQPLISVTSVSSGGTTYVEGEDYEVVFDESFNRGSVRASSGIRFTGRGTQPSVGSTLSVTYVYDDLTRIIQSDFENNPTLVYPGRDLLVKQSEEVPIVLNADLFIFGGFNFDFIRQSVENSLISFFTDLRLGEPVQISDIQQVVRGIAGVDNFIINRISRIEDSSGQSDIELNEFEYASLDAGNITLVQG